MASALTLDLSGFDRLFEHRSRLAICVLLSASKAISFRELKLLLGESDGNLGAQLRKLEDAAYIKVRKEFQARKPVSLYNLTRKGQKALNAHVEALRRLTRALE